MKLRRVLATAAAVIAAGTLSWSAGLFQGLPIVGQGSYCMGSFQTAPGTTATCVATVPAGPSSITGNELIPADTQTINPQSAFLPIGAMIGGTGGPNVLVGPDFGANLWQRGTTPVSAVTAAQALYAADGWYVFGNGTQITASKQNGASDVFSGSTAAFRLARPNAQTGTGIVCIGQLVPDDTSQRFIGNTAVFSTWMLAGANFSPSGSVVTMTIAAHTAADASASANGQGTNTGTFATSIGATQNITGYTELVNQATVISTTWTRYSVSAAVPATISGSTVTGVGVKLCATPVGTAGANDWFEIANAQCEARVGLTATAAAPTQFHRRTLAEEYNIELARYFQWTDPLTGTPIIANGFADGTTNQQYQVLFPVPMRIAPTTTPITASTTIAVNVAGTLTSPVALAAPAGGNVKWSGVLQTTNANTSGQGTQLVGTKQSGATAGLIGWSAEP